MPVCVRALAVRASALNYTIEYEMDAPPTAAGGGFYPNITSPIGPMTQGSATSAANVTFANGKLRYVNGANGPVGYYWHPDQNPCPGTTLVYTVDMMVKANVHTGGTS